MKYAVISDVHANLEALTTALAYIDATGVDRIVCPGDLVGYYTNPNEVIEIIRTRNIVCIAGNHDRMAIGAKEPVKCTESARQAMYWTRENLTQESLDYLASLPSTAVVDQQFLMVHASLHPQPNDDNYLITAADARRSFDSLRQCWPGIHVCFFGHTHRCAVYVRHNGAISTGVLPKVNLRQDATYLINPGSVAQPRDGDQRAAFLIYDSDQETVEFLRVTYDREACMQKAAQAGLLVNSSFRSRIARWLDVGRRSLGLARK